MRPSFDPSQLSPGALSALLRALPPRPAALLRRRLVQRHSQEACAAFYGVTPEAFSVQLLREALVLTTAARGSARAPGSTDEEAAWARQLSAALERDSTALSPGILDATALCRRLLAVGPEVDAALNAAERVEAASPRRKREDLLRRAAVVLLLALAAYFYWNRPPETPQRPPPRPIPGAR